MNKRTIDALWRKWLQFVATNNTKACKGFYLSLIKRGVNPATMNLFRDIGYVEFVVGLDNADMLHIEEMNDQGEESNGNV